MDDIKMRYNTRMAFPQVGISGSAARRIAHADCWVFRDELAGPAPALPNGSVVELIDARGTFLAYAFFSASSHVAARVVSTERSSPPDRRLFAQRLRAAIARRAEITGTNAKRLVFSEADGVPGLIVDQYGDYLVMQSRTAGIEVWKEMLVDELNTLVHPAGILERSDKEFREEEGLPAVMQVVRGAVPDRLRIEEDGLQFWVDPYRGHKTGFYLDQRETRRRLRALIRSGQRVLDVCSYTGAFGIMAAAQGARVVCVEQQEAFIALAKENAALNHVGDHMTFVAGDAFYWLQAKAQARERADWVLLDPPALAKSKTDTLKARQALHHLLVNAIDLLDVDGTLALSVCTYHLLNVAEEIVRIAASERHARLRIRGLSMQATDHPWILQMPMTRYLMTWIAQRDGSPSFDFAQDRGERA